MLRTFSLFIHPCTEITHINRHKLKQLSRLMSCNFKVLIKSVRICTRFSVKHISKFILSKKYTHLKIIFNHNVDREYHKTTINHLYYNFTREFCTVYEP